MLNVDNISEERSTTSKTSLIARIQSKQAIVGVVGLGYVGLPFAVEKAKVGFSVVGIDRDEKLAGRLNKGKNHIPDVRSAELANLVSSKRIKAVSSFSIVPELDIIVICVPTPLTKNLTPDLSHIENATKEIAKYLRRGQLICLESTTYPGTTKDVMLPLLEKSGLKVEKDFFLVHSPERVDPGNKRYTTANTNKVIGGVGPESLEIAVTFYSKTIHTLISVSSSQAAELTKVFENTFRAVNIALVNELAMLCDKMKLNVWEVLDAAFTKPFGILPFYPGPGVGGHCIPLDPHYLEWKAKEHQFEMRFISLAGQINRRMPAFVRDKVIRVLNEKGKAVSRSKILFIGMAYKKDLGDTRESPAIDIFRLLKADGAQLSYHDPFVPVLDLDGDTYQNTNITAKLLKEHELVIISTDHTHFDYSFLVENAELILDTRYATRGIRNAKAKIVLL
jgi:UDP-N-acetyl-D-glucosamine dehydrogenase